MYEADRTNHAIGAIDARTNTVIGVIPMPNGASPNGVLVAPPLHKLVVTDGRVSVFVWDLSAPQSRPDEYIIPGITAGTDALDYDPFNETIYVINGTKPYFLTGISLALKTVTSQLALPGSPELMRFNSFDGLLYQVITDGDNANKGEGVLVYDPVANAIKANWGIPNCVPHGIDIDPVSNVALLGCGTNQGQVMLNLKDGSMLKSFPDVTGTDLLVFNPNNRRFYTGSGSNVATTSSCAVASTKAIPVIGIFDAIGSTGTAPIGRLDGVACAGRGTHGLGVNPLNNDVFAGSAQYPVDPNSATTGAAGVLLFNDPAPPAQAPITRAQAILKSLGTSGAQGTVQFVAGGRGVHLGVLPTGIVGASALVAVSTTAGYDVATCAVNNANNTAVCSWDLVGDPLIGSMVTLSVDGLPVARGMVTAAPSQ